MNQATAIRFNPIVEWATDKAMRLIAVLLTGRRLKTVVAGGLEHVPYQGPALLVARHYHHLFDGLALFAALKRRFHIVVTLDWAGSRATKLLMYTLSRLARWPMVLRADALEQAPPPKRQFTPLDIRHYQTRALRDAVTLLDDHRLLVIFPEGYPNIDPGYTAKHQPDEFLPFKPGFIHIAKAAERRCGIKIPMIPVGIHYRSGPPWVAVLRFGAPFYVEASQNKQTLIANIEHCVKELSKPLLKPDSACAAS
jgi:1-acyl-sn-glycerol-3-phosphate acyltransferase